MVGPEDINKATRQENIKISEQNESLEEKADKPQEVPKPKTAEEINAEVKGIDDKIAIEREALTKVRQALGLETTDMDTSVAIDSLRRQREQLLGEQPRQEAMHDEARPESPISHENVAFDDLQKRQGELNENPTRRLSPEQATESVARQMLTNVSDTVGRLANIFKRRDGENLYPLLERQDVSRLGSAAQSINARSLTTPKDREEVAQALEAMSRAFDKFGSYRATTMRENPDSLKALATFAGESTTHLRTLQRAIASGDTEEVARAAGQLANKLEDVRNKTTAIANRANRYLGR